MNNFNKLNLDITKYSNLELKEILGLNDVTDNEQIQKHLSNIQVKVSDDTNMSFADKSRMLTFLNEAKAKLDKDGISINNEVDVTFNANTSYLVSDTPDSNPIIRNPNTLVGSNVRVYEGKGGFYPPGYLNPINTKTIRKTINIDSRFRDQYYNTKSSDFHFDLPETFRKVVNLNLVSYEMPLTIYTINNCNNHFTIDNGNTQYNIDISNGNYFTPFSSRIFSLDSSANIINKINTNISEVGIPDISYNIDPVNGKSYFTNTAANNSYEIFFNRDNSGEDDLQTPLPLKLGWSLGFRVGQYFLNGVEDSKVYSEGIVNFDTPKYLYISIDDFTHAGNNGFVVNFNDSTLSKDIITRINYSNLLQNDGFYNRGDDDDVINANRSYYGPVDIKKLHIRVMDEYGRIVDFNNMDWSFTLNFDILYD
jgi:hypothetical protein